MPTPKSRRLFVTGTDTGIGKTVLSLLLMRHFFDTDQNPFYIKLIQTGCRDVYDVDSDARFIYENVPVLRGKDPAESVPYCFANPKAPWFAARDEGRSIDLKVLIDSVAQHASTDRMLILEGAGGLFVPIDRTTLMIDLISMLDAAPILAARAGLGTINHTLLSIEAMKLRGIDPLGVVLIDSGDFPATPGMVEENIQAIEAFSGIRPVGVIKRIDSFSNPGKECFEPISKLFGRCNVE
ncbi:MAG: dethiobiotin synthase [Syntrophobacteraceae bacterium]